MSFIEDGKGTGIRAAVDKNNRLRTQSLNIQELNEFSRNGKAFYLSTGFLDITTTGIEHGIFYLQYTGNHELHVQSIRTCGTVSQQWTLVKAASTGTFFSGPTTAFSENLKVGAVETLSSVVYSGGEGKTITDGTHFSQWINGVGHSIESLEGAILMFKNDIIALKVELAAAGTVCSSILVYEES